MTTHPIRAKKSPKLKPRKPAHLGYGPTRLEIVRCAAQDSWGVEIGDFQTGHRLTPSKRGGSWTLFKAWELSQGRWLDIAALARAAGSRAGESSFLAFNCSKGGGSAGALLPLRQVVQALHALGTDPTQESVRALTTILLSLLDTLETNLATPQEVHPNG